MARPQRPWFRFYVEAVCSDRKIRRLDVKHRWLWVAILAAARQSPTPGLLLVAEKDPMTLSDLADFAGMKVADVKSGMQALLDGGLVAVGESNEWKVVKWDARQFEGDFSRTSIPEEIRQSVLARCGYACVDCGITDDLQIDHIIPVTEGGGDEESNLQILCGACNRKKGNRVRQRRHRRHAVTSDDRDMSRSNPSPITSRLCTESESQSQSPESEPDLLARAASLDRLSSPVSALAPVSNSRAAAATVETGTGCSATGDETETPTAADLAHRLSKACTAINRDIAVLESRNVVHWAIRHVDARLIEDAVIWAESRPAGQQLALPRGLVPTIRNKAKDRGISMPDFDPRKFA